MRPGCLYIIYLKSVCVCLFRPSAPCHGTIVDIGSARPTESRAVPLAGVVEMSPRQNNGSAKRAFYRQSGSRLLWKVKVKLGKLECGPMPNVMAALPNIGGALRPLFNAAKFG